MDKKTIYFICTGNYCRSQMAEGWGKEISYAVFCLKKKILFPGIITRLCISK
ncbi:hypothetical protein JMUB7491_27010 [Staphylococcus aureus]